MDHQLRDPILRYKHLILMDEGRTPVCSGHVICKAFVDGGISAYQDLAHYLRDCGIQIH